MVNKFVKRTRLARKAKAQKNSKPEVKAHWQISKMTPELKWLYTKLLKEEARDGRID